MSAGYMATATSSASDDWPTPSWLVDQLATEFGAFDLDPAATAGNAKAPRYFTEDDDGLSQPWCARRVFLNPPYGRTIGMWMAKARAEAASGNADRVVCLVPAKVDTQWWRDSLAADPLVRIWPGRISFGDGIRRAPFASAIIVFGRLAGRHGTEPAFCAVCGGVYWPAYKSRKTCSGQCWKRLYRSGIRRPNLDAGEAS
jgi:site-specific DNA-methyltransferase (adenine-specific)